MVFDFLKRQSLAAGLTGIELSSGGIGVARVERQGGTRPRLRACEFRESTPDGPGSALAQIASQYGLKHARCTTLLGTGDYQLLLTEAPDVGADELKQALRWKIKDLIDFHINDATLDVFDLPGYVPGAPAREMYTVAARNEAIQKRVDLLTGAGIGLEVIDIPELAQRNLAALLPEDTAGVALLSLQEKSGLVTITRRGSSISAARSISATSPCGRPPIPRSILITLRSKCSVRSTTSRATSAKRQSATWCSRRWPNRSRVLWSI